MHKHSPAQWESTKDPATTTPELVAPEPHFPWPADLEIRNYGVPQFSHFLFDIAFRIVRRSRPRFRWLAFHREHGSKENAVAKHPAVIEQLERLFWSELGTTYTPEQRTLLIESDLLLIALNTKSGSIAGYSSSKHLYPGTIQGVSMPVTAGCHEVVGTGFQKDKLGSIFGSLCTIYGHGPTELLQDIAVVVRTNNKNILRPLQKCGLVHRSDQIAHQNDGTQQISKLVIEYMHHSVFGLRGMSPIGHPLKIKHTFDERFTIRGLGPNEIVYLCTHTTLARLLFGLLGRKRSPTRKSGQS